VPWWLFSSDNRIGLRPFNFVVVSINYGLKF
jgi:hypothetical protein